MLSTMRGWRLCLLFGAMAPASGLGGCGDLPDSKACLLYACESGSSLSGSVTIPEATEQVDAHWCRKVDCIDVLVDVTGATRQEDCSGPVPLERVCLTRGGPTLLYIAAGWDEGPDGVAIPKEDVAFSLRLSDHATGDVLLEHTQVADYEPAESADDCHHCFGAEMHLPEATP